MDKETREQLDKLTAESFAVQTLFSCLIYILKPQIPAVTAAFDEAAHIIEDLALGKANTIRYLPEALKVVEQMRVGITRDGKPKHAV